MIEDAPDAPLQAAPYPRTLRNVSENIVHLELERQVRDHNSWRPRGVKLGAEADPVIDREPTRLPSIISKIYWLYFVIRK
jgi:hypothetical protein